MQNLQGNITAELGVGRPTDRPHAALADEGGHVVVPEAVADAQSHEL